MANKIVSPGVFTNEIDQSFLPAAVGEIGAALIGPTVKGPALVPTIVSSFSEYERIFGTSFKSGSSYYQYLTSHTAEQYLRHSGQLTVVRILAGNSSHATVNISSSVDPAVVGKSTGTAPHTGSITLVGPNLAVGEPNVTASLKPFGGSSVVFKITGSSAPRTNTSTLIHVNSGSSLADTATLFAATVNNSQSLHGLFITASAEGATVGLTSSLFPNTSGAEHGTHGAFGIPNSAGPNFHGSPSVIHGGSLPLYNGKGVYVDIEAASNVITTKSLSGGRDFNGGVMEVPFKLHTLGEGSIVNSGDGVNLKTGANSLLLSGSKDNLRYEVFNVNKNKGTFGLAIRRGDDSIKRKQTLESYTGLTLDPNSPNFIGKAIGDQVETLRTDEDGKPFLQLSGSYPRKSQYVRVEIKKETIDYLDENGSIRDSAATASLPSEASGSNSGSLGGSFSGGTDGNVQHPRQFYENIAENNSQGLDISDDGAANGFNQYIQALDLLSNQDEYDINMILTPGVINSVHGSVATKVIDVCEDRGDCFAVIDPVEYGKNVVNATDQADGKDSSHAAMYWPWVKIPDSQVAGTARWVPPSVVMGGVIAFNDKVAHPWFAPAGLNRGVIETAVQAERKLTKNDRDSLYNSSVNPIATFPGQGVVVFGQKTLQKKASALDRVNVRRLLINVKKFIASSSRFLVFEQNTSATRRRFLSIVNPFLEQVQSQSGLTSFRVVMDETNNTPDTIDRNQLVGQLFLQPARTAEFIVLDFTVQRTGAAFPE
tara:strand:+ start:165 stop:2468 length:2304 start_codon:yes stop_codon:yes gene_type:complete